jgi:thiamine-monophosphate kinase
MKITETGEEGIIELLKKDFPAPLPLVGIGDDCAIIPIPGTEELFLVTTDALVEGTHFLSTTISPHDLGYKTAAVNLSDIAAKGGTPLYAFLSLALPKSTDLSFVQDFLKGLKEGLGSTLLLGGDTVSSSNEIFINLTLIGKCHKNQVKKRDQAKAGDIVCIDGYLGDSRAGLDVLQKGLKGFPTLVQAHQRPRTHLEEGQWLATQASVHAMMDLSDGLATDLPRLLKASNLGCQINLETLPISPACKEFFQNPLPIALAGGEEYCLLFTVAQDQFNSLAKAFKAKFGRPFFPIGKTVELPKELIYLSSGEPVLIDSIPLFKHF